MSQQAKLTAAFARIVQALNALAGRSVPTGGLTGQVLTKSSGVDFQVAWATPAGGGLSAATQTVTFQPGEAAVNVEVMDAGVAPSNPPKALSCTSTAATPGDDMELSYNATLVSVGSGTFTARVTAADVDGDPLGSLTPQAVTLNYLR